MRSCWGKSTGNGIGDPDEMLEQGQAAGDSAEERGISGQFGWMGGGPSKMKNKWGRAQTLMLWPRGLFLWPLCYFLPHSIQTLTVEGLFPAA